MVTQRNIGLFYHCLMAISILLAIMGCASGRIVQRQIVTPEIFGAVGNGIVDDTDALKKAFSQKKPVELHNKYRITESLFLQSSMRGNGTIIFDRDGITINCEGTGIAIQGIVFDYKNHYGRMLKLNRASKITINDCTFTNVGTIKDEYANGMLVIAGECRNVAISNCRFTHCISSPQSSAQGIWIQQKNPATINQYIYVRDCYFDDFQTIEDADAIKVLGDNYDCYLYAENCEFRRCAKRAMKFQGRECHSSNNKIYVTEPMYCAIAFQRGYGSTTKDTIIIDYDGKSTVNKDAGLLYRAITISQGHVKVEELNMLERKIVNNTHQAVLGFVSYGDDDRKISDVMILNSHFSNGGIFMKVAERVSEIEGLTIKSSVFVDHISKPVLNLHRAILKNSEIGMDVQSGRDNKINIGVMQMDTSNTINIRKK